MAAFGVVALVATHARAESWTPITARNVQRTAHVSARLASGKLLFAGGQFEPSTALVDLFDPKTFAWTGGHAMNEGRAYFCAVPLDGGKRVFVAGGTVTQVSSGPSRGLATGARSTAEIYDESTDTWTFAKPMAQGRNNQLCALLPDGRILVPGGSGDPDAALSTVEIYDPKSGTWSSGPPLPMALESTRGAVLPGGDVLVVGGGIALRWSSSTSTWVSPGPSHAIPTRVRVASLEDGRVLILGQGAAVLYEPIARVWTDLPPPPKNHIGAAFAQLPGKKLLVIGGLEALTTPPVPLADTAILDEVTNKWSEAAPMTIGRVFHTADVVEPGRVLVVGNAAASAEEIWNALPGVACTSDDQCASNACVDGYCCDRGCKSACEACNVKGKEGTCTAIDGAPLASHATCAPYKTCAAGKCADSCATDADCVMGDVCFASLHRCGPARGLCNESGEIVAPSGQKTSCAPYSCGPNGECLTACASTLDCAPGSVCSVSDKKCAAATVADPGNGGCSTHLARGGSPFLLLLAAFVLLGRRRRSSVVLGASLVLFASSARAEAWRPTRPVVQAFRSGVPLVRLADDRILAPGGAPNGEFSSAEIYDVGKDQWTATGDMSSPRSAHTATLLTDGRVLVVGGFTKVESTTDAAEVFDPAANKFALVAKIPGARAGHVAIRLDDGRVLVASGGGGTDGRKLLVDAQIFDPKTAAWSAAGTAGGHAFGAAARLPDGRVLVAGGIAGTQADIFDPKTGAWSRAPNIPHDHATAYAHTLRDGRVLVVGTSAFADLFDPATSTWTTVATNLEKRDFSSATLLPTGELLLVGGTHNDGVDDIFLPTSDIVDPIAKTARRGPPLSAPRAYHGAVSLADGRVLVVGGISAPLDSDPVIPMPVIFELQPGSPCTKDLDCASSFCTDGRCCKTRCHEACNACDGNDEGTCGPLDGPPKKDHDTCAPFGVCIAGGCAAACANDSYCDATHVCDPATGSCVEPKSKCDGDDAVDTLTGERKACSPYACGRGKCATRCGSSDECRGGAVCDQGACTTPSSDDPGNCSYGARAGSGAFFAIALLLGAVRRANARPPCRTRS